MKLKKLSFWLSKLLVLLKVLLVFNSREVVNAWEIRVE